MVRNSLEYSFLPGASLWQQPDKGAHAVSECGSDAPGAENPSEACAAFLNSSEKAEQQWELERRFHAFEASP
jgi:adenosine deaminase